MRVNFRIVAIAVALIGAARETGLYHNSGMGYVDKSRFDDSRGARRPAEQFWGVPPWKATLSISAHASTRKERPLQRLSINGYEPGT